MMTLPPKRSVRFFNTTGPCNPEDHYMLPPEDRLVGAQLHRYIRDKLYWVLHAPRQTGKTTFLKSWMREINSGDKAVACYVSIEREYAAGRGRMDLFVEYNAYKYVIEIKLIYEKQSPDTVRIKGLEQTAKYRDTKAPECPAYLVLFDRREIAKDRPWDEKIYWLEETVPGGSVTVVGC
jgi:hypothetical protein